MNKAEKCTTCINIPEFDSLVINRMVSAGHFDSRSDAIRYMIDEYSKKLTNLLKKKDLGSKMVLSCVNIDKKIKDEILDRYINVLFPSFSEFVRQSIRGYTLNYEDEVSE